MTRVLWTLVKRIMRSWRCEIWLDCSKQPPLMWSFCPIKAKRERTRSVFTLTSALSFEKWRLRVWLLELLICRLHVKVDHVSDFTGIALKENKSLTKGVAFRFNSVVRTTEKYSSDNKFYFKASPIQLWLLQLLWSPPFSVRGDYLFGHFSPCLFCTIQMSLV